MNQPFSITFSKDVMIGTKRVYLTPMTRGQYNVYRGWEIPADENPAGEGYLVEYLDGGTPNDPRHAGYISWSPKEVADRTYSQEPRDHVERMAVERDALAMNLDKLATFLKGEIFAGLSDIDQSLLHAQYFGMQAYLHALIARINRAS